MSEIFTPSSLSIKQVFDAENYYKIPTYQRPYSWDNEQIDELWDDLMAAFEDDKEEYFLGSIIVSKATDDKYLEVIDGQQRLTTLMILFCVLRDLHYKGHKDEKSILGRIRSLEDSENRLKLRTQRQNQNKFEQEILDGIDFDKKRKISEIKADKFINSAIRFKEKIEEVKQNPEKLDEFKEYILNRVKVILVKCSNPSFAMKLFEVLNTRGLDLTASDIIKSNLMSKLSKEEDWDTFEQEWISIEQKAKDSDEQIDDLSQDFMEIDRNIHIEHILPREYKKDPYWIERFTEESAEMLVNSIGNLTLLSGKKNIAASCNSFIKKVENNYNGKGDDGITRFIITQNIVNDSAREEIREWNKDKIKKRRDWIIGEVERIFKINLKEALENEESYSKSEKLLHYALDNNTKIIDKNLAMNFIDTLKLKQFGFSHLTHSQWKILKSLTTITHSKKRGATSTEIADEIGITRPAVIVHLKELKNQNIIEEKMEAKKKYYYIKPIMLGQIETYLSEEEI